MHFHIIHLARAKPRKPNIELLANTVPGDARIVDAVDANELTKTDLDHYSARPDIFPKYPFQLRLTEIACFLSHRRSWQRIVESGEQGAMVFEDDVVLSQPQFLEAFELISQTATSQDYIRFPHRTQERSTKTIAQLNDTRIVKPDLCGLGAVAQYVGRDAAERLLKATERFDRPVDTLLQMSWVTGQTMLSVWPSGIMELSSQLGGSTIGSKQSFREKLNKEIARPVYRAKLWIAARRQTQ